MPSLVSLDHVHFSYGGEPVLNDINFEVQAGDYVGVIGPNGGGKSTLIKLMLGLLQPTSGSVTLWGQPARSFGQRYKLGYVPQRINNTDFRLPITVEEVVAFGLVNDKPGRKHPDPKSAVQHALQKAGIADLAKRSLHELSGGQQQRAFIAKALVAKPEILVLDEPTVGVDVAAQDDFYQLVASLNKKQGLTIIMVSHDIDVVVNEVSKLACINRSLVYHGHPKQFMREDYLDKLYGKTRKLILHGH